MAVIPAAFPFIEVNIDTSGLTPVAQRAPGVIAVVGKTAAGAGGGTADPNTPLLISTVDDAASLFAKVNADKTITETPLFTSLKLAMLQDPKPSKIYGVKVTGDNYAAALSSLEAADDVTFVSLANETNVGAAAAGGNPVTGLLALKDHVETMLTHGQKRIGVAMVDPTTAKSAEDVKKTIQGVAPLKSDFSRMVLVAARGATGDVATAAMATIAGYAPQVSMVLKKIQGASIPLASQYSPSEIIELSEAGIIPIVHPSLLVGESLYFGEGRCFTSNSDLPFIDTVRVLDDIDFRLKAGLIGAVGDARITKAGMTLLKVRVEGILAPLLTNAVIADYSVTIPVLNALNVPESAQTATEGDLVKTARTNRSVDVIVTITYGPAVHHLKVTLAPKF